ncbi:hypothetical protein GC170_17625 [bacterium]|nr:hypothetical protein [bacterium]
MALRMILTAMVVSMSLPLPSVDTCRSLVNEMNQELSAALSDVGTELVSRFPDGSELLAVAAVSEAAADVRGETKIYTIDETFANILDEFAVEAARPAIEQASIEQAAIDARRIPLEPVIHPLPPAVEATEVLPSAADLIRSVSEEFAARPIDAASQEWSTIAAGKCGEFDTILESIEMTFPVNSADIGPWQWVDDEGDVETPPMVVASQPTEPAKVVVTPVESITSDWLAILIEKSMEDRSEPAESLVRVPDSHNSDIEAAPGSTIRDAFRKTAEAIALWSKVMTRPY